MANPLLTGSLRLLNAFASSELAERYGLHEPAKKWVARGTKLGAELLARAAERAKERAKEEPAEPALLFDLTPTEPQELVRATMRRFAEESVRPAAAEADEALGPPPELLEEAAALGLTALAIPEALGGAAEERSPTTWALIAEELARGDLGLAVALLAPASAAHLVLDHGTAGQQRTWLPAMCGEDFVAAAPALLERAPLFDPRRPSTKARPHRKGLRLRGEKALVALGRSARFFVVSVEIEGRGPRLVIVEHDRPGVSIRPEPAMGMRAADLCTVRFDDVELPADALLGEAGSHDAQRVVDLGRLAWCALGVGQAQAVFEHARDYANERVAFGEPISNRQSIAFLVADMAIELEGLRLMTWRAAARAERGLSFTREAHLARVQLAAKGPNIGTDGVQVLGGAGFLREHPVERWYRHLAGAALMEGGLSL